MSHAPNAFFEAVTEIQSWLQKAASLPGEAVVRQVIVLRLLQGAGFNIWNPSEVVPEETSKTGSRADFLIRTTGGRFALELKGMNVSLSPKDYEQVATYAANESTRWAILTNGLVWSVMDTTHNPAQPFHEREVLKVEWNDDDMRRVADDLFSLLSVDTWRNDDFEATVKNIKRLQQKRKNIATVLAEKMPEVEAFQKSNTISDFEKAAFLYAQLGKITEEERDILISSAHKKSAGAEKEEKAIILLSLKYRKLKAKAELNLDTGEWKVLKGSELTKDVKSHADKNVKLRRDKYLEEGKIKQTETGFIFTEDVIYKTPSAAAGDLAGDSMSGWDVWLDENGLSAQHYRKKKT